ncbi:MAG: cytosine permease, partial [Gammaproteobacteria bacterium]|nr:cytosine permease [Gammaproteobacteria bacterium]
ADYFVLRRRRVSIRGIYTQGSHGPYAYLRGFNPCALIALVVGCALYMALLNPLTFDSRGPYEYATASLPATLGAGLVYLLACRLAGFAARS